MIEQNVLLPDWFSAAIEENVARPHLRGRMRQAAADGLAIARLQAQRDRVGFLALPLGRYVQGIAKLADVHWDTIRRLAGADPMRVDEESIEALAKFGAAIGFDLRSFRAHCRIGLAEGIEGAPMPILVACRGNGAISDPLVECEAALFELESGWEDGDQKLVKRIEELIREGFYQDPE